MEENLYTKNCIRTFTGLYINVFEPTPEMICIEDIAHSLSMQPRFGGHLSEFYSVAQHCVLMTELVREMYHDKHMLATLLHDASEAYILDIPRPIKNRLTDYKNVETRLMSLIAFKFAFKFPLYGLIKKADEVMLEWELNSLMLKNDSCNEIRCWSHKESEEQFLKTFHKLNKEEK